MANYIDWNNSIIDYYTSCVPKGNPVFLSLNDIALVEIGTSFIGIDNSDCIKDFEDALREECTQRRGGINTGVLREINIRALALQSSQNNEGKPICVAFIAGMVLASHRMQEGEGIGGRNYFRRLTQLLLEEESDGRPEGLDRAGAELKFWKLWNDWLSKEGWQITAREGLGAHRYIDFPISQSLLRDDDINFLKKLFFRKLRDISTKGMDEGRLKSWILGEIGHSIMRKHLKEGFLSNDITRSSAFFEAAFEIYEDMDWVNNPVEDAPTFLSKNKTIKCGLLRSESSVSGNIIYRILPKQPRNWKQVELAYTGQNGNSRQLKPNRRGYFQSLWDQVPFVENNLEFPVSGDPIIKNMIFHKRDYWVLAPDPEDTDGEFGSWNDYDDSLGTKLIVLIKEARGILHDAMEMYKSEGLINWEGDPMECGNNDVEWKEYRNCMVLKNCWDGVIPTAGAEGLYHRLKPGLLQHASIRLEGGLHIPDQNAWLENYPPDVVVYGFNDAFKVKLFRKEEHIGTRNLSTQEPLPLSSLTAKGFDPGIYTVTASHADYSIEQGFSIISWDDLLASSGDYSLIENYQIGANGHFRSVGPLTLPPEMP